jgi:hypothetical protein
VRPFPELVDDLVADVGRAPDVREAEMEALGFAMGFESVVEDQAGEAARVVEALRAREGPAAEAALRSIALFGRGSLREASAHVDVDLRRPPAADVGRFEVEGVWRAAAPEVAAHFAWLGRPGGVAQSFVVVTGPDLLGAPLLGGGMSNVPPEEDVDQWLAAVVQALGTGAPAEATAEELLGRLRRGAGTNDAVLVEVSAALAMGARLAAHALAGAADAVPALAWAADEGETDDDRAAYVQRVLVRAVEEGVDPTDREALLDWYAGFQDRAPARQLRGLGVPAPRPPRADAKRRAKRRAAKQARRRNR